MKRALLLLALTGCTELPLLPVPEQENERLSELGLFSGPQAALSPAQRVVPYEVTAQLWADFAEKDRFLFVPVTETIGFDDREDWSFPVGSIAIKNFSFPLDRRDPSAGRRIIETRLLVREADGWVGHVYLWNDEQTDAVRFAGGTRLPISYLDEQGDTASHEYVVPNTNQCTNCHARDDRLQLLGVITPQLNREVERDGESVSQLAWLAEQGLFGQSSLEQPSSYEAFAAPFGEGDVEPRARAWLHANCAHCHRPGGAGGSSGLVLLAWETDPVKLGICKFPAAAGSGTGGHEFDVVPGSPDESIMPFRIASTDPEIKMPELPNRLPDTAGLALVEAWIAALTPAGCP